MTQIEEKEEGNASSSEQIELLWSTCGRKWYWLRQRRSCPCQWTDDTVNSTLLSFLSVTSFTHEHWNRTVNHTNVLKLSDLSTLKRFISIWPTSASGFVLCLSFSCCQPHFGSSSFCLGLPLLFLFPFMKLLDHTSKQRVLSLSRCDGFYWRTLREHMVQVMSAVEQTDQQTMQTILLWAN